MIDRKNKPQLDDDMLTAAQAVRQMQYFVHHLDTILTDDERFDLFVRRGALRPGVKGGDGKIRWRRGYLLDVEMEVVLPGRKRRISA